MSEEDIVEVEGKITAVLPSTMFRAELEMIPSACSHFRKAEKAFYQNYGWRYRKDGDESTRSRKGSYSLPSQKCGSEPKRTYP